MTIWSQGTIKEMKGKGGYLEKYPFSDWEPVKLFEKLCNMLMFAFSKNDFVCMILIFWRRYIWSKVMSMSKELQQSKRLRRKKHISWTVALLVRRWRTELILLISRYSEWLMWSICFAIEVSVNVNPEAFDMAFERNIMTANSQMAILWHTDPLPFRSIHLHFFQSLSRFLLCRCVGCG